MLTLLFIRSYFHIVKFSVSTYKEFFFNKIVRHTFPLENPPEPPVAIVMSRDACNVSIIFCVESQIVIL